MVDRDYSEGGGVVASIEVSRPVWWTCLSRPKFGMLCLISARDSFFVRTAVACVAHQDSGNGKDTQFDINVNRLLIIVGLGWCQKYFYVFFGSFLIGQCFGNPNPYNLSKKYGSTPPICTAVRPPFVSLCFPGFLRRKGNPAIRLPFVLQYASHLYGSTPPFVRQYFWKNTGGWGHRNVSDLWGENT